MHNYINRAIMKEYLQQRNIDVTEIVIDCQCIIQPQTFTDCTMLHLISLCSGTISMKLSSFEPSFMYR